MRIYIIIYMVGTSRYDLSKELLKDFKGKILGIGELKQLVMRNLASSGPIIVEYLKLWENTGLTKEVSHLKFKIIG